MFPMFSASLHYYGIIFCFTYYPLFMKLIPIQLFWKVGGTSNFS
jgi:hypothetical protein